MLDEPFSGLDPGGVDDMRQVLAERAAAGVTVLFSSHQLDLVEDICEAVAIIHRGRLVIVGPVADLRRGDQPRRPATANAAGSQRVLDLARAAGPVEHFAFEDRPRSEVFRQATGASVGEAEAEHAVARAASHREVGV